MDKTERYERGLAKLKEIYGEETQALVTALGEVTPDLSRYVVEFAFGDIHCRTGLSLKVGVTEHTIRNYLSNIYDKIGVSSRVELALYAITREDMTS